MFEEIKLNPSNKFYPFNIDSIKKSESKLGIEIPQLLKEFYIEVGYGFIKSKVDNVNRVMVIYLSMKRVTSTYSHRLSLRMRLQTNCDQPVFPTAAGQDPGLSPGADGFYSYAAGVGYDST